MAKILVVDDEHDMIWALTNVLLAENHSVVSVDSGEEALNKVKDTAIDLVLLDYRLPGMDGIQILEKIKEIKPDLPIIMVTGYGGIEEAVQAIKLGATDYIPKPFDNDHLIQVVNKALQMDSLKKGGVFEKRLAEKIDLKNQKEKRANGFPIYSHSQETPKEEKIFDRRLLVFIPFLVLSILIGGAALYHARFKGQKIEYVIPNSRVSGISLGGSSLWVSDWFTQTIYQYQVQEKKLALVKSYTLNGYHLTGIAFGNNSLYTCDSWKKKINRHYLDGNLTVAESFASPGPNPSGLYHDGKYLWSSDGTTKKIYQHADDDKLTVLASFDSPGVFPVGLYHDKKYFWSAGASGMKIFRNSLSERFALDKTYLLPESQETAKQISAFTIQEDRVWYSFEGTNTLYNRSLKDLTPAEK